MRVTRPGGLVCVGAHGREHYWEAIDATLRCIDKRYVLGYRFEWWPRSEACIKWLLENAGLGCVRADAAVMRGLPGAFFGSSIVLLAAYAAGIDGGNRGLRSANRIAGAMCILRIVGAEVIYRRQTRKYLTP